MIHIVATIIVIICWLVYLPMFMGRGGPGSERKDRVSTVGIILQFSGVGVILVWRRPLFTELPFVPFPLYVMAPIMAAILAVGAVWISWIALKTIGRQWSFVAGVTAEHRLIQTGPYAFVRHPLFVCFFGLTFATGIVWSQPRALPVAVILFWAGVWIRVWTEERLLREMFGTEFDSYAARVPSFIPGTGKEK